MKKVMAVLLSVMMLFSCLSAVACAADTATVTFRYKILENGVAVDKIVTVDVEKGSTLDSYEVNQLLYDMVDEFDEKYTDTSEGYDKIETKTYTFKGFMIEGSATGEVYYRNTIAKETITDDITFEAQYHIDDTASYDTFWEFVQSIFARINRIFEYFSNIFGF